MKEAFNLFDLVEIENRELLDELMKIREISWIDGINSKSIIRERLDELIDKLKKEGGTSRERRKPERNGRAKRAEQQRTNSRSHRQPLYGCLPMPEMRVS
jgi:hypothetical protein